MAARNRPRLPVVGEGALPLSADLLISFFLYMSEGSFSAAARRMNVQPGTVRSDVLTLSKVLGCDLSHSGDGRPTGYSEELYRLCRGDFLALAEAWEQAVQEVRCPVRVATTRVTMTRVARALGKICETPVQSRIIRVDSSGDAMRLFVQGHVRIADCLLSLEEIDKVKRSVLKPRTRTSAVRANLYQPLTSVVLVSEQNAATVGPDPGLALINQRLGWVLPSTSRRALRRLERRLGVRPRIVSFVSGFDDALALARNHVGAVFTPLPEGEHIPGLVRLLEVEPDPDEELRGVLLVRAEEATKQELAFESAYCEFLPLPQAQTEG